MLESLLNYMGGSGATSLTLGFTWLAVDLLASMALVVSLERVFPLRPKQPFFRSEWVTDFQYFTINHLAFGLPLIPATIISKIMESAVDTGAVRAWTANLPFPVALLLVALITDLVQYWVHRMYHAFPALWRFHVIHHTAKSMDWLSGSRQHIVELMVTRTLILVPFMAMGFTTEVLNTFIVLGGLQAVLNHSNVKFRLGWLGYVLVTPQFHHWHHSRARKAIDRNFASHFAFLDHLFGTAVKDEPGWPCDYGLERELDVHTLPGQFLSPFLKSTRPTGIEG